MQELTIRRANADDIDSVYRMLCLLSRKEYDRQQFEACYLRNITNVDIIYLIAEADGEVCGFISCHAQQLLHHAGTAYEIQEMFVDEAYRGKGIGKKMLATLLSIINLTDYDVLEVTSSNWREDAHAFYMNHGFAQTHLKFTMRGNR
ncbi:hypothetical protein CAP35_06200 [Chitinophagaceae bacterium IBVUCB1]|nr:hypothetical protein CAP35_06200 [Chitinophagaceae bacterium IBVUCB1]